MALIVHKYGGTSVGTTERIQLVADKIVETKKQGHQIVVVVSAMSGETNRLLSLAKKITEICSRYLIIWWLSGANLVGFG